MPPTVPARLHSIRSPLTPDQTSDLNDEIDNIYRWLKKILGIAEEDSGGGTGPFDPIPHALLGPKHTDTTTASPVEGDLVTGGPGVWDRLPVGADGDVLVVAGGVPTWSSSPPASIAHNVLSTTHEDSIAADPVLGDIIVAQGLDTEGIVDLWMDGAPLPGLIVEDTGGVRFWADGLPMAFLFETPIPQWARKAVGAAGQVLTSDGVRPDWADPASLPSFSANGVAVHRATDFSLPDATPTKIDFTTEVFDEGGYWDPGSPSRFTVPEAGWYALVAGAAWDSAFTGVAYMIVYVNGVETLRSLVASTPNTASPRLANGQVCALHNLAAGAYIEIGLDMLNGGSPFTIKGGGASTYVQLVKV